MMDNKTCSVDILSVSLGDLPVDEADQNRIARLSAELIAQAEQYAVELGIQAYLEFTRTLSPEMNAELEGHKDNEVPETWFEAQKVNNAPGGAA